MCIYILVRSPGVIVCPVRVEVGLRVEAGCRDDGAHGEGRREERAGAQKKAGQSGCVREHDRGVLLWSSGQRLTVSVSRFEQKTSLPFLSGEMPWILYKYKHR